MPLEEGEGISESQVSFYDIAGHSHDGTNSTQIDFSAYNVLDIIDIGQLRDIIMGTVNNSTLSPNMLQVGFAEGAVRIDGAAPSTVTNLTASSSASTTSDGNSFIDASWVGSTNDSINRYVIELHKSETGVNGTYVITRSHETTALSHRFERIDTNAGDVGNIYYKVIVYAISPVGVYSVPATSSGIVPAVNTTPPANTTFNDDYAAFDEGVKPAFKGMFVYLDDNTEFDVKELRGKYEYQVSVNKTSFDTSANLKASGKSKSTYFLVNNLEVRASAGGSKIDYYLRVRAINSSGTASTWVYYKNTADGGSSGAGTTTASAASAINVLEIDAGVDVQANTITANEIFAGTITATEIESATITGDELNSITINASRYIQSPDFVSGSAGWKIEGDGNAEFSEVTVRGVVYANTGRMGGTNGWTIASNVIQSIPSAANAVHLNSGGGSIPYLRMGAKTAFDNANTGVWLDPTNGLVLGSGTTGAWIKPDGKFYLGGASGALQWDGSNLLIDGGGTFTGALSAATGTFAGALSAATGTFSGTLTSSVVVSGSIDIGGTDSASWHVDSDGNMWWGSSSTYSGASIKISNQGSVTLTDGTFSGDISGASGTFTDALSIGSSNNILKVDASGNLSIGHATPSSAPFQVSNAGAVTASNVNITGGSMTINNLFNVAADGDMWIGHATQGSAPFQVDNDGSVLCSDLQVTGGSMAIGSGSNILIITTAGAISSGHATGGVSSPFHVAADGTLYATNASITGDINAGSTITGSDIVGGTISISSGKFAVDVSGNLIAKSISLGDASAPTSYSNSMIMGGSSRHKIRISSSAFGLYSSTTALEWYDSNLSTRRGYLTGGQLASGGGGAADLGVQMGGDDNKQNYVVAYQTSLSGDGVKLSAHKTSYNDICISAGGVIDLNAVEGIEIAQKSSAPSSASGKLYNHNGTLKWGTTTLGSGGGGMDSWFLKADGESPGVEVTDGEALNIAGSSNISVTRFNQSITIAATGLSLTSHNHSGVYATSGHNHSGTYYESGSTIRAASGSSGAPGLSFSADTNLGWYRSAENVMTFTAGNSIRLHLSQNGMSNWPGTAALPSYSFLNDANTGMWQPTADTIAFSTGQYERARIDSSGRLGVAKTNPSHTIHSGGTIYATNALYAASNSYHNGACMPWVSNSSNLGHPSYFWDDFYHSGSTQTSDVSLKENIEDATYGLDFISTLRPVTYTKKTGGTGRNGPRTHHGFIAQEIETLLGDDADHIALWADGYYPAVSAEEDPSGVGQDEGHVQGLRYVEFIPILTKAIQELEARLAALEA